ncbi:flagellin [Halalkalibacillus halophilus]|uniref:flagellin N-terminal helical domain-containing protein n=1 Tax=Halalkalibacillus halophilus TaxID=392827 RepID=UPI0004087E2A|nr:flagellin [Halalkalibacillus halophilus]
MIINNNIPAMNTYRQMGQNQNDMQSSMEKLSSGLRINRAGDDAAGLAISEKMRAQINGLDQASRNAQDGISLIQTAEGALDESHSILQRMRELAVQSSNDTNVEVDRQELQKEMDQLSGELSRIADNTQFNTQDLLNGEFDATFHIGANEGQNIDISIEDMGAQALGVALEANDSNELVDSAGNTVATFVTEETDVDGNVTKEAGYYVGDGTGDDLFLAADEALEEGNSTGISISSQETADSAISTINDAIETVSSQRSELGAVQNRLEHTISNLDNASENLSAAESRIRDADMASEMMEMTRANILSQASQSMLAQANQQPQSVLQLLG